MSLDRIRRAEPHEAEALSCLARSAKQGWGYAAEVVARWREDLQVSAEHIAGLPCFVIDQEGRPAGFYCLAPGSRTWALQGLWVDPALWRRGLGGRLMLHACDIARQDGAVSLSIDADPNAEAFYLHCGARRTGVIAAPLVGEPGRVRPQLVLTL
jgi:GNAT superfamily N-acetyltransferase